MSITLSLEISKLSSGDQGVGAAVRRKIAVLPVIKLARIIPITFVPVTTPLY